MHRLRRRLPASALGKARLAGTAVACLSTSAQLPQMGSRAHGATWHAVSTVALILLVTSIAVTYRRGRTLPLDPVLGPALVVTAGSGLGDSVITTGLALGFMISRSMYGSPRGWLVSACGATLAVPLAVALSPFSLDNPVAWNSPTVIGIIPQLVLVATVLRTMYVALRRQDEAGAREAVLARTGSRLLGVSDVDEARDVAERALAELAAHSEGATLIVFRTDSQEATVVAAAGPGRSVPGVTVPMAMLTTIAAADGGAVSHQPPGLNSIVQPGSGLRNWRGCALPGATEDRFLLIGARREVRAGVFDAFLSLSHQLALAEASCISHAELNHQAHHDHLTTLPTRALFFRQLVDAVEAGAPGTVALLNIDLDDFKQVNDRYGHAAGDELLIEVAARLVEAGGPHGVPARFGGDEFALLLTDLADPTEAIRIAERVCQRIIEPVRLPAATVSVGASIGVAGAEPTLTAGDLLRCADIAMYSAKAGGKNRVERFTADRHGTIAYHRMLEEHLAQAITRDELTVRYQPLLDLRTGECTGVEALAYWAHPTLGLLDAAQFVPLVERTGQVGAFGAHILRTACRQFADWSGLPQATRMRIGVNVTARQVLDPGFADTVAAVLTETGMKSDRLLLEIVESEHMDDPAARAHLRAVAAMGVGIALDDFGTGYVSLTSLRSFPVHQIKTDPDLCGGDEGSLRLVISVGELLGTETVVQGLTNPAHAANLRSTSVASGQGSLFGPPMPAADFTSWLTDRLVPTS